MAHSRAGDGEGRAAARRHIEEHVLEEASRIERLSRVREFVLGAQDGLLVPLGVVTGMAAANPGRAAILVAGLAEAVAGCIAMGGGSYLASEAEEALYAAEIADERREVEDEPEREVLELALVLEDEACHARRPSGSPTGWRRTPTSSCVRRSRRSSALSRRRRRRPGGRAGRRPDLPRRGDHSALALRGPAADRSRSGGEPRLHAGRPLRSRRRQGHHCQPAAPGRRPAGPRHRLGQRCRRLRHRPSGDRDRRFVSR